MNTLPTPTLQISPRDMEQMRIHIDACLPEEACGLLGGLPGRVSQVVPITNHLHSRVRFRMEPSEQLAAFQLFEAKGIQLVGIYHSHPNGPQGPSETDIGEAYYPEAAYLIWQPKHGEWRCRAFRIDQGRVEEIQMRVSDG